MVVFIYLHLNALCVLPSTRYVHNYNCLDDAMVVVVIGIIPYALVFDVLHGFYSLFSPF